MVTDQEIIDNQNENTQKILECIEALKTNCNNRIAELEQENAELKDKLKNLESVAEVRLANWQKYEEENKELKKKIENLQKYLDTQNSYRECAETWVKLTKAIEILKKYHNECPAKYSFEDIDAMVEQFLKEDK